ncbi:ATPase family AAA domain-containing protein FIGL1 [Lactuca sativa]|uniref:ATPase family AAA domain-containing protein FIGL1 n=1 Tax=Lactuca sativa TaxID=4236 RepID=UPI000CD9E8EF|nr:ATPase family AAA domain-containing protein FIGL1 [Lactuca sativa]
MSQPQSWPDQQQYSSSLMNMFQPRAQAIARGVEIIDVDEEKTNKISRTLKRARIEISPKNEQVLSQSSNKEANAGVTNNSLVTDATKMMEMVGRRRRWRSLCGNIGYGDKSYTPNGFNKSFGGITVNLASFKANGDSTKNGLDLLRGPDGQLPQKLRNIDPRLIEQISNEIMDCNAKVCWDDIAGLHHAKKCVNEMVIWPLLRPDIFKGCRSPGRGLLLFGPPGTGKTMIGKAIAGESKATFFYISASSITSKWVGEGEKLVRALFGVARCHQPAVIFVDEIDSLLSKRDSNSEHAASRPIKTQFLIEMDGFNSGNEQILLIGATNRPQALDEAARRRLTKGFYIPLPSAEARAWIVRNLLNKDGLFKLSTEDIDTICKLTDGYSGSDMTNLVKDASMGPIREILEQGAEITNLKMEDMRSVTLQDFKDALQEVRTSVSQNELGKYEEWNNQFGSLSTSKTM